MNVRPSPCYDMAVFVLTGGPHGLSAHRIERLPRREGLLAGAGQRNPGPEESDCILPLERRGGRGNRSITRERGCVRDAIALASGGYYERVCVTMIDGTVAAGLCAYHPVLGLLVDGWHDLWRYPIALRCWRDGGYLMT